MAKVVVMPKMGYTQETGQVVEWHKAVGDTVKRGEPFFDVHTDKSVLTVESGVQGTVLMICLEPGIEVPVLSPIAVVGKPDENPEEALATYGDPVPATSDDSTSENSTETDIKLTPGAKKFARENNIDLDSLKNIEGTGYQGGITLKDIKISPLARKIAEKNNLDIAGIEGSGVNGKIMKADVEKTLSSDTRCVPTNEILIAKETPYNGVRKIIGDRLAQSKFTAPHLYFTDSIDMTRFTALRKTINDSGEIKISASDLLIKAASKALIKFPAINSALIDDRIITYESTNIGMAVAGDTGLVVPVVKNVQVKGLTEISVETRDLVERAKVGRLKPEEYSGGTFSISNLGMFGIKNFTAIINPPEAAILSISSIRKTPVVITNADGEDEIVIRPMMNVQLSVDHRIIDGLLASQFVEYYKTLLEHPELILI